MVAPTPNADELRTRLLARLDALFAGAEPTPPERSWLEQLARDLYAPGADSGGAASHVTPTTARPTGRLIAWPPRATRPDGRATDSTPTPLPRSRAWAEAGAARERPATG